MSLKLKKRNPQKTSKKTYAVFATCQLFLQFYYVFLVLRFILYCNLQRFWSAAAATGTVDRRRRVDETNGRNVVPVDEAVMQALGLEDRDVGFQRAQQQAYEMQGRFGR